MVVSPPDPDPGGDSRSATSLAALSLWRQAQAMVSPLSASSSLRDADVTIDDPNIPELQKQLRAVEKRSLPGPTPRTNIFRLLESRTPPATAPPQAHQLPEPRRLNLSPGDPPRPVDLRQLDNSPDATVSEATIPLVMARGPTPPPRCRPTPTQGPYCRLVVNGRIARFPATVEGFDHPYLRGYTGIDSSQDGKSGYYYAVRQGWEPGIYKTWGGAWARTIDYHAHTGQSAVHKKFKNYADAVDYLGWDPASTERPFQLQRSPPPRRTCEPSVRDASIGQDPHEWCCPASSPSAFNDPGDISLRPTMLSAPSTPLTVSSAEKEEKEFRKVLNNLTKTNLPSLPAFPTTDDLRRWRMRMEATMGGAHWQLDGTPFYKVDASHYQGQSHFQFRAHTLSRLLVELLATDHLELLTQFQALHLGGAGLDLYTSIHTILFWENSISIPHPSIMSVPIIISY